MQAFVSTLSVHRVWGALELWLISRRMHAAACELENKLSGTQSSDLQRVPECTDCSTFIVWRVARTRRVKLKGKQRPSGLLSPLSVQLYIPFAPNPSHRATRIHSEMPFDKRSSQGQGCRWKTLNVGPLVVEKLEHQGRRLTSLPGLPSLRELARPW